MKRSVALAALLFLFLTGAFATIALPLMAIVSGLAAFGCLLLGDLIHG